MRSMKAFFVLLSFLFFVAAQKKDENWSEEIWSTACEFVLQYHSQWPLRRTVIVYHPLKNRENYLKDLAMNFSRRLSQAGVSSAFVRIPGAKTVDVLRLNEPNQPTIFCILMLTPDEATSGFVRAAADAGGLKGDLVSWIHISAFDQRKLTADVGLRPDTQLTTAYIQSGGVTEIYIWNGITHKPKTPWSGKDKLPPDSVDLPTMDLTNQKLSVAIFHDPPFVSVPDTTNTTINETLINGWMMDIWKDLQNLLKFNSTYYKPTRIDTAVGVFKRAVEELKSGRADVVLYPFVVMADDLDVADFSIPVTNLKYRFLLPRVSATSTIDQFIQPFQILMWRVIAAILTFAVILITVAYILGRYYGFEEEGTPLFQLKESIMIIYGSLFAQGPDFTPLSYSGRMVLWMSFLFGLLISQAYSAALISKLTVGTLAPPFTTLDEMLSSTYTVIFRPDSAPQRLVYTARRGSWRELGDRKPYPRLMSNLQDAVVEVSNSWTETTLLEAKERLLPMINQPAFNCKTTMLSTDIFSTQGQLMFSKSSPYKSAIDQQLIAMLGSGRLARARATWLGMFFNEPCPKDSSLPQFGMQSVILPFAILGGGLVVAAFLLGVEYTVKKWFGRLLNEEDGPKALQEIARRHGYRMSKHWMKVKNSLPIERKI